MLVVTDSTLFVGLVHATCNLSHLYPSIEACVELPLQHSCENTTVFTNSCCNVVKGGLVLQTQYWDTYTSLERFGQLLPQGSWVSTVYGRTNVMSEQTFRISFLHLLTAILRSNEAI